MQSGLTTGSRIWKERHWRSLSRLAPRFPKVGLHVARRQAFLLHVKPDGGQGGGVDQGGDRGQRFLVVGFGVQWADNQCALVFENSWMTATPAIIRPIPAHAARSGTCRYNTTAISDTSTIPAPLQIA